MRLRRPCGYDTRTGRSPVSPLFGLKIGIPATPYANPATLVAAASRPKATPTAFGINTVAQPSFQYARRIKSPRSTGQPPPSAHPAPYPPQHRHQHRPWSRRAHCGSGWNHRRRRTPARSDLIARGFKTKGGPTAFSVNTKSTPRPTSTPSASRSPAVDEATLAALSTPTPVPAAAPTPAPAGGAGLTTYGERRAPATSTALINAGTVRGGAGHLRSRYVGGGAGTARAEGSP